jgi:hypothetical protein
MPRRFKPPWFAERMPGGHVVKDANHAHVYARETKADADIANVLTMDDPSTSLPAKARLGSGTRLREACGINCGD